jgi:hypothetical protein
MLRMFGVGQGKGTRQVSDEAVYFSQPIFDGANEAEVEVDVFWMIQQKLFELFVRDSIRIQTLLMTSNRTHRCLESLRLSLVFQH